MSSNPGRDRRLLYIALGILSASVGANVLLTLRVRSEYAERVAAQVWPMNQFPTLPTVEKRAGEKTLALLGDSRVAEWGNPSLPQWRVFNAGVRGQTSAQLALQARSVLDQLHPDAVLIQVGINDLKLCGPRPELRSSLVSNCLSNIANVVAESRRAGAFVWVTTVWPAGKVSFDRRLVWSSEIPAAIIDLNKQLEVQFARQSGVRVTNIFAAAAQRVPSSDQISLFRDTVHLKPESYTKFSAVLAELLVPPPNGIDFPSPQ